MAETFNIYIGKFKATAEQVYCSQQVSRHRITLKGKCFVLEQQHLKKTAQWKIKEHSEDVDVSKLSGLLASITEQIENYHNPKVRYTWKDNKKNVT